MSADLILPSVGDTNPEQGIGLSLLLVSSVMTPTGVLVLISATTILMNTWIVPTNKRSS